VTDINAALMQQVFNNTKRKRKTHIHHHSQADDFRRCLEVAKWRGFCHPETLRNRPALFKSVSSDIADVSADRFGAWAFFDNPNVQTEFAKNKVMTVIGGLGRSFEVDLTGTSKALAAVEKCQAEQTK
jgi:hypothetical protein